MGYKEVKREMEEPSGMRAEIAHDANVAALGERCGWEPVKDAKISSW